MKPKLRITSILLVLLMLASLGSCSLPGIGIDSGEVTSEKAAGTLPPEDITFAETALTDGEPGVPDTTEFIGPFTEPVPVATPDPPETHFAPNIPPLNFQSERIRILYGTGSPRNEFNADISGGQAYGLHTIWFNIRSVEASAQITPDHTIRSLSDLTSLL